MKYFDFSTFHLRNVLFFPILKMLSHCKKPKHKVTFADMYKDMSMNKVTFADMHKDMSMICKEIRCEVA